MNGTTVSANGLHHSKIDTDHVLDDLPSDVTEHGLDRRELVRIIVQTIDALGYSSSARALEKETGIEAMTHQMRTLRDCVLLGRWDQLESVLSQVTVFKSSDDARAARFVLYEQKFLELLEAGHTADALECLRNDLTRLSPDPKLLHKLPLLCMCTTPEEVRSHASWPGAGSKSRTAVLERLQQYIPSNELLQENRLQNLLCQTIDLQKQEAMFPYTRLSRVCLLEDMIHYEERLPRKMLHRLEAHADEVWFVQFSNRGDYLVSGSKDTTLIIWRIAALQAGLCTKEEAILHRLKGHSHMVCFAAWSPDDKRLATCGSQRDFGVRIWDVKTGDCLLLLEKHKEQVTAVAWMPDGRTVVSAGHDFHIYQWSADNGECLASYSASAHVNDIRISHDGRKLIATTSNNLITIFDTNTKQELANMSEKVSITSLCLANDGDHLLVLTNSNEDPDMRDPEIHLWSLSKAEIVKRYKGFKQTRYVIRGCFAGHDEMLVLSGSEDNQVHIWARRSGNLLARLEGHDAAVNSISCSSTNQDLFATASDDKTVIVSCTFVVTNLRLRFLNLSTDRHFFFVFSMLDLGSWKLIKIGLQASQIQNPVY